jgi:3-deoxy-7-phosphoheptulonate synthase
VGRIGGQYAKPRTCDYETLGDKKVQVFRGEIVNDISPDKRIPDPERMYSAYMKSILTMDEIFKWNVNGERNSQFFKNILIQNKYELPSESFRAKLLSYYELMEDKKETFSTKVYTSHEGLLLPYEQCFLQMKEDKNYDLSAHLLWIGERTNNPKEAHVEFFRGIENPLGIKISGRTNLDELITIINTLNPENEKGKIVLITRFGSEIAETCLEALCEKLKILNLNVIFFCDPNHGNTKQDDESKKKVRYFHEMKEEIIVTHKILSKHGMFLSGIHLESSSFHVTECLGGESMKVERINIENYTSYCDPRLNMLQTMELCDAFGQKYLESTENEEGSKTKSDQSIENTFQESEEI